MNTLTLIITIMTVVIYLASLILSLLNVRSLINPCKTTTFTTTILLRTCLTIILILFVLILKIIWISNHLNINPKDTHLIDKTLWYILYTHLIDITLWYILFEFILAFNFLYDSLMIRALTKWQKCDLKPTRNNNDI